MEKIIERVDDHFISYLQIYNSIGANPTLVELAKDLAKKEAEIQDERIKAKLLTSKKIIELEIETMKQTLITKESSLTIPLQPKKPIKIYVDGVFDIIHSGHFNALRQAKKLGDILVVGINSDSDVEKVKGPTIMNCHERAALAQACKWADIVVEDTPYTPTLALINELGIDYCSHGDDIPYNEKGECAYDEMIKAGKFKIFKRTEGVSTTEIIGRLLSCSKEIKKKSDYEENMTSKEIVMELSKLEEYQSKKKPMMSSFLATSHRIAEFSNNKTPKDNDKIIYIDGAFDILHIGHIETLKKAKELGDFLYVGVHDDETVNKYRGKNYPILNLNERVFNLLALKYVDEVIIGAPWKITPDMIKLLKISTVVQGTTPKYDTEFIQLGNKIDDPYQIPKDLGIYQAIPSEYDLSCEILVDRLMKNRNIYIKKYLTKAKKDDDFFSQDNKSNDVKEV